MSMIAGIHHVQITIPKDSEEKARRFYCGILGLKEIEKPENRKGRGGFWLELSNSQVHVGVEEGIEREKTKAHIAYEIASIREMRELLKRNGVEILETLPTPGYESIEFRDPFGNRVECIQRVT